MSVTFLACPLIHLFSIYSESNCYKCAKSSDSLSSFVYFFEFLSLQLAQKPESYTTLVRMLKYFSIYIPQGCLFKDGRGNIQFASV